MLFSVARNRSRIRIRFIKQTRKSKMKLIRTDPHHCKKNLCLIVLIIFKVNLHEGCGRTKLFWLTAATDANTLKVFVTVFNIAELVK